MIGQHEVTCGCMYLVSDISVKPPEQGKPYRKEVLHPKK